MKWPCRDQLGLRPVVPIAIDRTSGGLERRRHGTIRELPQVVRTERRRQRRLRNVRILRDPEPARRQRRRRGDGGQQRAAIEEWQVSELLLEQRDELLRLLLGHLVPG